MNFRNNIAIALTAGALFLAPHTVAAQSDDTPVSACNVFSDLVRTIATNRDAGAPADVVRERLAALNISSSVREAVRAEITLVYGSDATPDQLAATALAGCLQGANGGN
jgi:hypothetical protein